MDPQRASRPASVSESASSVLPTMTRLDATEVKARTKTPSSSSARIAFMPKSMASP